MCLSNGPVMERPVSTNLKVWVALVGLPVMLTAQEPDSRWRLSGFGTLGLASNSTDLVEYSRELSQPKGTTRRLNAKLDSRLGLQVNVNLSEDFSFVGQVVSKYRYDGTFTPDLSWAFLSYTPTSGAQVRVGRLGWDVFQLADTRNVGYSNLWARPPLDFYGPLQVSSMDGGDIAWSTPLGEGQSLRLKVSAGQVWEKIPTSFPGEDQELKGGKLLGSLAEFQGENLNFRVAYARFRTTRDFITPVASLREGVYAFALLLNDPLLARQADAMVFKDQVFHYYSAGLNWQQGPLRIDGVAARVNSGALFSTLNAGYASIGYRVEAVVPYVLASRIATSNPTPYVGALPGLGPQGAAVAEGIQRFLTNSNADQKTVALGLRWDFHPKAALKIQVDRVSADSKATMLWPHTSPGWDGKATLASVVLDFVF